MIQNAAVNYGDRAPHLPSRPSLSAYTVSPKEQALGDYATFFKEYILKPQGNTLPKHQEDWCDVLQDNDDVLLIAPACHGKTSVMGSYAIWALTKNRRLRIAIVTHTDHLAEDILDEIRTHFEENEKLIEDFGQFKPEKPRKWNRSELIIDIPEGEGPRFGKKDASITAGGAGASWKGKRFDIILVDDIIDEKNARYPEKCVAINRWFWETIDTRLEPWGKKKIGGTFESDHDLYHDIINDPRGFKIVHQQAIIDDARREVLWPEHWTYDDLVKKRNNNFASFMLHFQNVIMSSDAQKVSQEQINRCYNNHRTFSLSLTKEQRDRYKYVLQAVDPAWTKRRRSKYAVITTVGLTHENKREVLDIWREKSDYATLLATIKSKYYQLLPHVVLIETNQLQERLRQEVADDSIPTQGIFTSDSKNDIDVGIPMLYSVLQNCMVDLPCGDPISEKLSKQLITELLGWNAGGLYSDVLMTYYFIEKAIRERFFTVSSDRVSSVTGKTRVSYFRRSYTIR